MDHLQQLALVYLTYLITIASPGPSNMAIMGTAMNHGRAHGVALALGVLTGSLCWASLAAAGISTLLTRFAEALIVMKLAGGLYLLFLAWKSAKSAMTEKSSTVADVTPASRFASYRRGVLLHLTNPKAILGWGAIMTLGLKPDAPAYTLPAIIGGCAVLGFIVFIGYALLFSTAAMANGYRKARRVIEGTLAAVFGYAGLRLLLSKP
ncbi:LysE family translocator [Rhizobium sp. C1]|uniref:LysE family translocator n=1 Tax=Rhizobium sp. C1 TaxID=1349799 RepID=UPI001E34FEC6|nr:LysE family translocator [Rhizobium sp. C1]MCD2180041.1 LysE family translocator [Rhizobium sp. C1]